MDEVKTTETPQVSEPDPPSEPKQFTKLGEDIGKPAASQPLKSPGPPALQPPPGEELSGFRQFPKSVLAMQFSQRTWLVVATVFVGMVVLLLFSFMPRRAVQDKPVDRTLESITPEMVMARCGQPVDDVTKDLYPMISRTISYKPTGQGSVVIEFTRTSEENSQWLFLSMKDGNGKIKYETPDMQFAALPCLAPKK